MSYKGDDLDLRTPQTWSATPADLAQSSDLNGLTNGQRTSARVGPIWVDDTVLAVANYAFEIAATHRASEVMVEHLLHSMTRIDAASEALEARGVRVAALRRESATIIANEIPMTSAAAKIAPRRSEDFAEVFRHASSLAARRNEPADVDDLVQSLLDRRNDLPPLALLGRHSGRLAYRDSTDNQRYIPDARYASPYPDRYTRYVSERTVEAPRYIAEAAPRVPRPEPAPSGTSTDAVQNTRIDALEQMIRSLSSDLANERQVVAGLLRDLSRDTQGQRDEHGRLQSGLYDRLETLERVVTEARGTGAGDGSVERLLSVEASIERRLQDIEKALRQSSKTGGASIDAIRQAIDLQPISHRLDIIEEAVLSRELGGSSRDETLQRAFETGIERALSDLSEQTNRLEELIASSGLSGSVDHSPLHDRLTVISDGIQSHQTLLEERMNAVENAIAAEISTAGAKHEAYAKDLNDVHDAIMKLNQNQHTLAGSIDQWRSDAASDVAGIATRLANLDRDNERPIETLNALTDHMDTMNKLIIERYHRRNRFWYWLFGTDDWIGRSWPSQAAALEMEKAKLRAPSA